MQRWLYVDVGENSKNVISQTLALGGKLRLLFTVKFCFFNFLQNLSKIDPIWPVLSNFTNITSFLLMCLICAKDNQPVANWHCINLALTIKGILKMLLRHCRYFHFSNINPSGANITKWSNTLKQFVDKLLTNCLSVFEHFVGLMLKLLWRLF